MPQIQVEGMFFPQIIEARSYAVSYLLTMVFSFVISCCMRPKLKKIDMAESLKSIE
jgi:putative ABC transport system permease protein